MTRNKIFISHATSEDNEFTKWLAFKLMALGYDVWCDILFLDKGVDFWKIIENEIRTNTCKFLYVLSSISNTRDGVLKELAVAEKVKKLLSDNSYILPLMIDEKLSFDDINIDTLRLNAIDFRKSWGDGLKELIEAFEKNNMPKREPDPALYQQIFNNKNKIIEKDEIYDSNWFPIVSFPKELRFHRFDLPKDFRIRELPFPAIEYKNYICTFAHEIEFTYYAPHMAIYDSKNTIRLPTEEILADTCNSDIIKNSESKRLIVHLVNRAFELKMKTKDVKDYQMSGKLGFWIEKGKLDKDKYNKVQLIGKLLEKNWHFGISAFSKLYPFPVVVISSHIFFTNDGNALINSSSIQHSARRRQGKNWWNDDWKKKLQAFVCYLSDEGDNLYLSVGNQETISVSTKALQFIGHISYNIPQRNNLNEEVEILGLNYIDDLDENSEDSEVIQ